MADGTVTIKVQANDQALKKLAKSVKDLKQQLDGLSGTTPFDSVRREAQGAVQALTGVSDGAKQVSSSLDNVDAGGVDDIGKSANQADGELQDLTYTAGDVSGSLDGIDSTGIDSIGTSASDADAELLDLTFSAENVDQSVSSIDSSGIDDIGMSADRSDAELMELGSTADYVETEIGSMDASSIDGIGESADLSAADLEGMSYSAKQAADGIDGIDPGPVQETEESTEQLSFSLMGLLKSVVVVKAVSAGFDMLKNSVDGAIDRFDTLNIYPRTMEALGFSTDQVDRSMRKLDQGIQGLPTTLNDIVSNTQRIASVTGDLDMATDTALALNNAFLANGSSAADASRGTEQYVQMLSRGEVDMQSWRTLQETMTLALNRTAEAFGFAGESAQNDLYSALQAGDITFREFNAKLIELSNEVGGFADLAQTNSQSIRTAWTNIQTAFVRGTASIIEKLDELSYAITGSSLIENINKLQGVVNSAFGLMGDAIDAVSPIIVGAANSFSWLLDTIQPLTPVIKGVAAGFATLVIINQIRQYMDTLSVTAQGMVKVLQYQVLGVRALNMAQVEGSVITKGLAVAYGVLTGAIGVKTAAVALATKAWTTFTATITALTGPVGWVIGAIGLLVGGFVLLKNTLGETSPEMQALTTEIDESASATSSLSDQMAQSAESFESLHDRVEGQRNALTNLIDETVALSEQERLSSADKKLLGENIDTLNESMQGLNLAYDEEQRKLTASTEALSARVDMMEAEANMAEGQERLRQIADERAEATARLEENSRQLDEAQRLLDESGANWFGRNNELKDSVSELEAENANLQERIGVLAEQEQQANDLRARSAEAYAQAQEEASNRAITSLEELSDSQRSVVEQMQERYTSLEEHTTNMFDSISQKSAMSIQEMNANLEENQAVVAEWSEGLATLSERGVDQGLLEQLRRVGPEGLPYVQELVNATPEEMNRLEDNFRTGGETANQALFDSLGIESNQMIDGIPELATRTEQDLRSQIEGSGLKQIMPDELREGKEDMVEAGRDVAEGAAQGIEQGSEGVSQASKNMAMDADTSFKSELGIHSPSTVFAQHGRDIINGLLQGFNQGKPQVVAAVRQLGMEINQGMTQSLQQMSNNSTNALTNFTNNIRNSFRNSSNVVRTETSNMNRNFQSGMRTMEQTASRGFRQVERSTQTAFRGMSTNIRRETTQITMTIRTSMTQMTTQTQQGMQRIELTYRQGYARIRTTTQRETNLTTQLVQRSMRTQQTAVQNGMRSQQMAVQNGMRAQTSAVRVGYSAMVMNVRSSMNQVVSVTRSTMNQAVTIMRNTAGQARSAGMNMGLGFRNGLASTQGGIMSTARNIANRAASTIRSALKIHSPSRVTEALGKFTGEGMIVGMQGTIRDVERMANEMASKAIPKVNVGASLGRFGGGVAAATSPVYNNSYTLNANSGGQSGWSREDLERLFREFTYYIQQQGGRLE